MQKATRLIGLFTLISFFLSSCSLPFFKDGKLSMFPNSPERAQTTPSPTKPAVHPETIPSTGDAASCVIGSWKLEDVTGFETLLHAEWLNLPEAWEDRQHVSVTRSSGDLVLTFQENGVVTGSGDDYQIDAVVSLIGLKLKLGVIVNGTAQVDYAVDDSGNTIAFTKPQGGDMTVTIKLNNATMLKDKAANDMGILKKVQRNGIGLRFACNDDSMRIDVEMSEGESIPQAVMLTRIEP